MVFLTPLSKSIVFSCFKSLTALSTLTSLCLVVNISFSFTYVTNEGSALLCFKTNSANSSIVCVVLLAILYTSPDIKLSDMMKHMKEPVEINVVKNGESINDNNNNDLSYNGIY